MLPMLITYSSFRVSMPMVVTHVDARGIGLFLQPLHNASDHSEAVQLVEHANIVLVQLAVCRWKNQKPAVLRD